MGQVYTPNEQCRQRAGKNSFYGWVRMLHIPTEISHMHVAMSSCRLYITCTCTCIYNILFKLDILSTSPNPFIAVIIDKFTNKQLTGIIYTGKILHTCYHCRLNDNIV